MEEDFVITIDTSTSTSITDLNHKSIIPYFLKHKNIKDIKLIYSHLVDIFGDINFDLARFYKECVDTSKNALVPCFRAKKGEPYPLSDGVGVIVSKDNESILTKNITYGSDYMIVNFKDFCTKNDISYEELRYILEKNKNNMLISKRAANCSFDTKEFLLETDGMQLINLKKYGITDSMLNVIESFIKLKYYKLGVNSSAKSFLNEEYFNIIMGNTDVKSVVESKKSANKNELCIAAIKDSLTSYYSNVYDDGTIKAAKTKIDTILKNLTTLNASNIKTVCAHKLLIYSMMHSDRISKFAIKKNTKKLEEFNDAAYNRDKIISCNACGEDMICPHNLLLLKMIDESEFNKKNAISRYIIYNRKQRSAVCKVCKAELFGDENMHSIEYYSMEDYVHKEMSDDKLYKLIYKHINIFMRLPSIETNESILSKKDIIEMCIPCIYQTTQRSVQNYLKNNILSNEMKEDALNLFAMIYCAAFVNILGKKLKTKGGGFIMLLTITGSVYDILTNMYNQFMTLNKKTHAVEYSLIYNEAVVNINSNISVILNYIKNSKTNKLRQESNNIDIYWSYLIPDKRVYAALKYDKSTDSDSFFAHARTTKDFASIINLYPKDYNPEKLWNIKEKNSYYLNYEMANINIYKNAAKSPLHLFYDINGEKHIFKRNSSNELQCTVCGAEYKNMDKYAANIDKIKEILDIGDFIKRTQKQCPLNAAHTYKKDSIECLLCGHNPNWSATSAAAAAYYSNYKKKVESRAMIIKETAAKEDANKHTYDKNKKHVYDLLLKNNNNTKAIDTMLGAEKEAKNMSDKFMGDSSYLIPTILRLIRIINRLLVLNCVFFESDEEKELYSAFNNNGFISKLIAKKDEINKECNFKDVIIDYKDKNIFEDKNFYFMYLRSFIYNILAQLVKYANVQTFILVIKNIYNNYNRYIKVYNKHIVVNEFDTDVDNEEVYISNRKIEDLSGDEVPEDEFITHGEINDANEDLEFREDEAEDFENGRFLAGMLKDED